METPENREYDHYVKTFTQNFTAQEWDAIAVLKKFAISQLLELSHWSEADILQNHYDFEIEIKVMPKYMKTKSPVTPTQQRPRTRSALRIDKGQ